MDTIEYKHDFPSNPVQVARVLDASGIKRPTHDIARITRMFSAPCLTISAWNEDRLIGLCRALTDFSYCCYLSDLAVDRAYQHQGIGARMIQELRTRFNSDEVSLILLSAPEAMDYYPKLGFAKIDNGFVIRRRG
ncbi:MAG: GNAT family N-acetyltransferase [Burkholderiales bacterium]